MSSRILPYRSNEIICKIIIWEPLKSKPMFFETELYMVGITVTFKRFVFIGRG